MAGIACVRGVLGDAADALTDDEIQQTLDDLWRSALRRQRQQPLDSLEQALFDEAEDLAKDIEITGMVERRNAAINERTHAALIDFAETFDANDPSLGLEAKMVGVNLARQGGRLSVDARAKALEARYVNELAGRLRQERLLELVTRREGRGAEAWLRGDDEGPLDRQIAQELWEIGREGGQPGVSGSREARRVAEIIHTYQEAARQGQNRAGAFIRSMPGYIVRQSHDRLKLGRVTFEEWRDEILPRLDADRTFDGADPNEFLKGVFDGLVSGVHHKSPTEAPLVGFRGPANLGKRVSQERVLHFASSDDWFDYNRRFGQGNLIGGVLFGLRRAAQDQALMETFGPNPRAMFDRVRQDLRERHRADPDKLRRLGTSRIGLDRLEAQFRNIDGTVNVPADPGVAVAGRTTRALQTLSKLGGVLLSSLPDVALQASEIRYQGRGLLQGYGTAFENIVRGRRSGEERRIADVLGVGMEGMLGDVHARFSSEDGLPGTMNRLMNGFFKLNGLSWWTDAHKTGIGLMMARDLAIDAPRPWAELAPERRRLFEQFDLTEADWNLLRANALHTSDDGVVYMMPDLIREIGDDALPDGSVRQRARARDELETKIRAMITDRVDFAVLTPGARERSILNQGTQAGTLGGEFLRTATQFKSFSVAVISRALGREAFASGAPGLASALFRGQGDIAGIVHMIVATTVFGYAAMVAKDLAKGRMPRDPEDRRTWLAAFMQGGGAGIYGDFLFGDYNRFGGGFVTTALGPTAGSLDQAGRLLTATLEGDVTGAQAFRFAQSHVPGINLFYTRAALDYLILYQIQEMLSPGSLRRMERRVRDQNAQTFMLPPSQAIPYGGGDRVFEGVRG